MARNARTGLDPPASASTPVLVGRDDAFRKVTDALADGLTLVVVEGEAGIGKTRLLREALAGLGDRLSGEVLLATCPAVPEPAPLGAVVAGVRRLTPVPGALSALGGALRPLFPEWADELPPALEPLDSPSAVRHRVFRALSELLARRGVQVVVVEDVHWADTTTLEWLLTLASEDATGGPAIVVSYRPWDVPAGSLLPRLTSRTHPGRTRVRVDLRPLDAVQVRQLVASTYVTDDVSEQFAEFLHRATDGIPLVVEEYLRLLEEREDIVRQGGRWSRRALAELEVPASVRESVLERVHRLDRDTRRLLEAASVIAGPADESLLAEVAELGPVAARSALGAALAVGMLREHAPGQFTFRHVLDAQAVSESVPAFERRRSHARAAEVLGRAEFPPVARLSWHYREAGNADRWRIHAEASADLALGSGDDHTAVTTLLQVMGSAELPVDQQVRLARKLGEAAFFGASSLGDLAEEVVLALRRVLDSAEIARGDRGELRLLLGRMLWVAGDKLAAFEQWEHAGPDLLDRPDLAIRAMSNLALPLIPDWPAARHLSWLTRAGRLLDRAGPTDRQAFLRMRITALLLLGEQAGWEALGDLPRSASSSADDRAMASTLVNVTWAMLAWGRLGDAREHLASARRHIEVANYSRLAHLARATSACLDWYVGDWSGLEARAAELAGIDDADPVSRLHGLQVAALLRLAAGARPSVERDLREVVTGYARLGITEPATVAASAALARLHLADGDPAAALACTGPVVELVEHKGVWMWIADIAAVHVDALLGAARPADAADLVARFADGLAGRDIPAPAAALTTCRAIVTEAGGDPATAAGLFADAARMWSALPRPYDELLCQERRGRALLASDNETALRVLVDAQQRLHELGARWDADRVARLVREHGVTVTRSWHGGRRGYGDDLSPRELGVVDLVARGMTNRQIAESLFVSTRTVKGHVRSAMRKLGVRSRTALAIAAVENGLVPGSPPPR
ncbi:MAG TPA: LuxR C-terminal-related transcriptional regulator [Pseudonocardiaceae bacterium]